jgi:hypothetical protein
VPSFPRRSLAALAAVVAAAPIHAQPSAADWSALAALPDFSGIRVLDVADQRRCLLALALAAPLCAHHSTSMYDRSAPVTTYSTELPTQ